MASLSFTSCFFADRGADDAELSALAGVLRRKGSSLRELELYKVLLGGDEGAALLFGALAADDEGREEAAAAAAKDELGAGRHPGGLASLRFSCRGEIFTPIGPAAAAALAGSLVRGAPLEALFLSELGGSGDLVAEAVAGAIAALGASARLRKLTLRGKMIKGAQQQTRPAPLPPPPASCAWRLDCGWCCPSCRRLKSS